MTSDINNIQQNPNIFNDKETPHQVFRDDAEANNSGANPGIAKEGNTRYNVREELERNFPEYANNKEALELAERAIKETIYFAENIDVSTVKDEANEGTDTLPRRGRNREAGGVQQTGQTDKVRNSRRVASIRKGIAITRSLINDGVVSLVGGKFTNPEELATLAQVLRHPGYETFHVLFVDKKSGTTKVVGHEAVSSRLPGITKAWVSDFDTFVNDMKNKLTQYKANKYYLLHNHPSGRPNASNADIKLTELIEKNIPGFEAHIIINSNEYGVIEKGVRITPSIKRGNALSSMVYGKIFGEDKLLSPELDHPLLNTPISSTGAVANLAKAMQISKNYSIAVFLGICCKTI